MSTRFSEMGKAAFVSNKTVVARSKNDYETLQKQLEKRSVYLK